MPIMIFYERGEALYACIARQDLEARVLQVGHDETDHWGGAIVLKGGRRCYINPQPGRPVFPISLCTTRSTPL